ncbi:Uncharacterised protein [Mycobacterium tuberculosis]|nr:Uncharacterised protein [Mycobacterium tuberculosis]
MTSTPHRRRRRPRFCRTPAGAVPPRAAPRHIGSARRTIGPRARGPVGAVADQRAPRERDTLRIDGGQQVLLHALRRVGQHRRAGGLRAGVGPRTRAQRLHELGVNRRRLRTGHLIGPAVGGKQRRDRRRHLILGRGHDARRRSRRGRIGRAQHRAQSGQIRCRRPQHLRHRQHERHVPPPTRVSGPAPTTPPMTIDTDSDDKYTASSKTTTPFLPNTGGVCAAARGAAAHRVARPGARNRAAVSVTGHPPAPRGRCKPRSTKPAPPG